MPAAAGVLTLTVLNLAAAMNNVSPTWSQLPALPTKAGLGGCFAGTSMNVLLVAGGTSFPEKKIWEGGRKAWHDTIYVLMSPDGAWEPGGKLPRAMAYGVSVTAPDGLLCLGGADATRHYADVCALSWTNGSVVLRTLPSLPLPLAYAAGAMVADTIYITGGLSAPGEQRPNSRFLALNLSEPDPAWRELAPCQGLPRILAVACGLNGAFYLAGGTALHPVDGEVRRAYLRDLWRYRPDCGWEQLADLPAACSAGATPAPTVGSSFFVVGGDDGSLAGFEPMKDHPGFSRRVLTYQTDANAWNSRHSAPSPNATVQTALWLGRYVFAGGETRPGVRSSQVWTLSLSSGK